MNQINFLFLVIYTSTKFCLMGWCILCSQTRRSGVPWRSGIQLAFLACCLVYIFRKFFIEITKNALLQLGKFKNFSGHAPRPPYQCTFRNLGIALWRNPIFGLDDRLMMCNQTKFRVVFLKDLCHSLKCIIFVKRY